MPGRFTRRLVDMRTMIWSVNRRSASPRARSSTLLCRFLVSFGPLGVGGCHSFREIRRPFALVEAPLRDSTCVSAPARACASLESRISGQRHLHMPPAALDSARSLAPSSEILMRMILRNTSLNVIMSARERVQDEREFGPRSHTSQICRRARGSPFLNRQVKRAQLLVASAD